MSSQRHIVTEAIILKTGIINEKNKYFTFISPELGVSHSIAYGAASIKNRFCSSVSPFINAKLFLYKNPKNDFYKLEDISDLFINDSFTHDLKNIYLISFFTEIIQNIHISRDEFKNYFYLLKYSLELLENKKYKNSFLFFTTKFLFLSGYSGNLGGCRICRKKDSLYYFNPDDHSVYCQIHSEIRSFKISEDSCSLWKFFYEKKFVDLKKTPIEEKNFQEIFPIILYLIKNIFEKNLKTTFFLKEIF